WPYGRFPFSGRIFQALCDARPPPIHTGCIMNAQDGQSTSTKRRGPETGWDFGPIWTNVESSRPFPTQHSPWAIPVAETCRGLPTRQPCRAHYYWTWANSSVFPGYPLTLSLHGLQVETFRRTISGTFLQSRVRIVRRITERVT